MTAHAVQMMTADEVRRRRRVLLQSVGGDERTLRERAAAYSLDAHELAVLDEIDALDYLLEGADDQ